MKNLLLKDWSADWETPPYPPSRGLFAVYDYKELQDKINYAVTNVKKKQQRKYYLRMDHMFEKIAFFSVMNFRWLLNNNLREA